MVRLLVGSDIVYFSGGLLFPFTIYLIVLECIVVVCAIAALDNSQNL